MTRPLDDLLAECLIAIERDGLTLEQCLERYPDQRAELRPLLEAALALRNAPRPSPSPTFQRYARRNLLRRLPEQRAVTFSNVIRSIEQVVFNISQFWRPAMKKLASIAFVVVLLVLSAGIILVTRTAQPGGIQLPWLAVTHAPTPTPIAQLDSGPTGLIAFGSTRDGNGEIYLMNADGSQQTNITNNSAQEIRPVWSPDGQYLAFLSNRSGQFELYMINAIEVFNGTAEASVTQISRAPEGMEYSVNGPLIWSPDGALIAAATTTGDPTPPSQIDLIRADGSGSTTVFIPSGPTSFYPRLHLQWSPDGRHMALVLEGGDTPAVYILNADGTGLVEVAKGQNSSYTYRGAAWSPDGKRLAYLSNVPARLTIIEADTLKKIEDISLVSYVNDLAWSPDGAYVLLVEDNAGPKNMCPSLQLLHLGDNLSVTLRPTCLIRNFDKPQWSPDSQWLVFTADPDGQNNIAAIATVNIAQALSAPDNVRIHYLTSSSLGDWRNWSTYPQWQPAPRALSIETTTPVPTHTTSPTNTSTPKPTNTPRPFPTLGNWLTEITMDPLPGTTAVGLPQTGSGVSLACLATQVGGVLCWGQGARAPEAPIEMIPVEVFTSGVVAMAVGYYHTCVVTTDGKVTCWGETTYGQLGDGSTSDSYVPVEVPGLDGVIALTAGPTYTCALTIEGLVYCWGENSSGQLGDGTTITQRSPVLVSALEERVVSVIAGQTFTCALTSDRRLVCWGDISSILPSHGPRLIAWEISDFGSGIQMVAVGSYHVCVVNELGEVVCRGGIFDPSSTWSSEPIDLTSYSGMVQSIEAGADVNCILTVDGQVYCWGDNYVDQLGNGSFISSAQPVQVNTPGGDVIQIGTGLDTTCALVADGNVECWGGDVLQIQDGGAMWK